MESRIVRRGLNPSNYPAARPEGGFKPPGVSVELDVEWFKSPGIEYGADVGGFKPLEVSMEHDLGGFECPGSKRRARLGGFKSAWSDYRARFRRIQIT
jgi:hypothetical protein